MEKQFDGFEHPNHTQVPNDFFDRLLPMIENESELRVTLVAIRNIQGYHIEERELSLTFLMKGTGMSRKAVRQGLAHAIKRGTMQLVKKQEHNIGAIYGIRWNKSQRYPQDTTRGIPRVPQEVSPGYPIKKERKKEIVPQQLTTDRPNIFTLYENNIGFITPMIADELKAAINDYPAEWIPEAFKEAVKANVRKWNYTRAILERWKTSGRGETNKANKNGMSALELA